MVGFINTLMSSICLYVINSKIITDENGNVKTTSNIMEKLKEFWENNKKTILIGVVGLLAVLFIAKKLSK